MENSDNAVVTTNESTIAKITLFLSNKTNLIVIGCLVIMFLYFSYKKKIFMFANKNNDSDEEILDFNKKYTVIDNNKNKIKINFKEIIDLQNYYLEKTKQEQIQKQHHDQIKMHEEMQKKMQEEMQKRIQENAKIKMAEEVQKKMQEKQSNIKEEKPKTYKENKNVVKNKNKKKIIESSEENSDSDDNELELLKKELADLEKQNQEV